MGVGRRNVTGQIHFKVTFIYARRNQRQGQFCDVPTGDDRRVPGRLKANRTSKAITRAEMIGSENTPNDKLISTDKECFPLDLWILPLQKDLNGL